MAIGQSENKMNESETSTSHSQINESRSTQ